METLVLDINDPRVSELLSSPETMGSLEYLRRCGRPMTVDAMAAASGLGAAALQRSLDRLVDMRLVRAMPASGKRKVPAYEAAVDVLRITCDPRADRPALEASTRALTAHALALMPADPFADSPAPKGNWRGYFITLAHLTIEEVAELRKRLNALIEFTDLLARKRDAGRDAADPPPCNYGFMFRVEPLVQPAMPLPSIRFVSRDKSPWMTPQAPVPAKPQAPLSDREYQVALALARGLNQREVAGELGVKPSTVLTLTKRLYRKLRITRRAELVTRLREAYGEGEPGT